MFLRWWWLVHHRFKHTMPIRELRSAAPSDLDSVYNGKHKSTVVKIEQSSVRKTQKFVERNWYRAFVWIKAEIRDNQWFSKARECVCEKSALKQSGILNPTAKTNFGTEQESEAKLSAWRVLPTNTHTHIPKGLPSCPSLSLSLSLSQDRLSGALFILGAVSVKLGVGDARGLPWKQWT